MNQRPHLIDVLVEELEILVLWEILKHLLKAKLEEKISPSKTGWVVLNHSLIGKICHYLPSVGKRDFTSQAISLILNMIEVLLENLVIVIH